MKTFENFLDCWLNQSMNLEELDDIIEELKRGTTYPKMLSDELNNIIKTNNYENASEYIRKHRGKMNIRQAALFVKYLYNKLSNIPTDVTVHDICHYEKINVLKEFFEEYSQANKNIMDLDTFIKKFRKNARQFLQEKLVLELNNIVESNNYSKAAHYIKKYGKGTIDTKKVEIVVKYLINKISELPTDITANDLTVTK